MTSAGYDALRNSSSRGSLLAHWRYHRAWHGAVKAVPLAWRTWRWQR